MPLNSPRQTFIPKKSLSRDNKKKKHSSGIFFVVSVLVFLLTIAYAGGIYGYRIYMENKVESLNISLERAKAAFEPDLIRDLKRLDSRIISAQTVLDEHIALSEFFDILGKLTLKSVQFERFSYVLSENSINIDLNGLAGDYSSVALQSDIFGESSYIQNPLFSNLGLDDNGNVTFDFSADIDKSVIMYK